MKNSVYMVPIVINIVGLNTYEMAALDRYIFLFIFQILLAGAIFGQDDLIREIRMSDGSTYIGKVVNETDSTLTISNDILGSLVLSKSSIRKVTVQNEVFGNKDENEMLREIRMSDGSTYIGKITNETDSTLTITNDILDSLVLNKSFVRKVIEQSKALRNLDENTIPYQYFAGYNGFNLKAKESVYRNQLFLLNTFDFGITDNFSLGVGSAPFFYFEGAFNFWTVSRFTIPMEGPIRVGFGVMGGIIGNDYAVFGGYGFGNVTYGNANNNVNIGIGLPFASEGGSSIGITVSGMLRISKKIYLISENFIRTNDYETSVYNAGVRLFIKRVAIEAGVIFINSPNYDVSALPLLGLSVPLKKNYAK